MKSSGHLSIYPSRRLLVALVGLTGVLSTPSLVAQGTPSAAPPLQQATPGDTTVLSLDVAVGRALSKSREVQLAAAQVKLAGTQVTSARSQALPQINGEFGYTRTFRSPYNTDAGPTPDSMKFSPDPSAPLADRVTYLEDNVDKAALGAIGSMFGSLPFGQANSYVAQVTGSQILYSGGRVGAALKIAKRYQEAAELTYDEAVSDISLQVRTAYYQAVLASELESIAAAAVEQAQAFYDQESIRFNAGTISELDLLRAEVSLENLKPQLVEGRNAKELAELNLKRLLDLPLTQPVLLTTSLIAPTQIDTSRTEAEALRLIERRPVVQAAEKQVAIKEQQVSIARGAYLPSLQLNMVYGRQLFPAKVFDFSGADWNPNFTATIGVSLPIFTGFKRHADVQLAKIELDQSRLQLSQLKAASQLEYEQARGERERSVTSIGARQRTVDQASRVYDLTVLRYEKGLATQLEASEARLALLQARTNLAQAISDYYIADAKVAKALGARATPSVTPQGGR